MDLLPPVPIMLHGSQDRPKQSQSGRGRCFWFDPTFLHHRNSHPLVLNWSNLVVSFQAEDVNKHEMTPPPPFWVNSLVRWSSAWRREEEKPKSSSQQEAGHLHLLCSSRKSHKCSVNTAENLPLWAATTVSSLLEFSLLFNLNKLLSVFLSFWFWQLPALLRTNKEEASCWGNKKSPRAQGKRRPTS